MKKTKELTTDEIRKRFLEHIHEIIDYWQKQPNTSEAEKVSGVAFSILVMLDGGSMNLPEFIIAPNPHPDDKKYFIKNGVDYFPENHKSKINSNIGGYLHELLNK